jgi:hypothetical protein
MDRMYYEKAQKLLDKSCEFVRIKKSTNYRRLKKLCDICIRGQREGYLLPDA